MGELEPLGHLGDDARAELASLAGEGLGAKPGVSDLYELEERQQLFFLRDVRPVGEEKSELYDEPRYFHIAMPAMALRFPAMLDAVEERLDSRGFGRRMRRVLSPCGALHVSAMAFTGTWAREMVLSLQAGERDSELVLEAAGDRITDSTTTRMIRFAYETLCAYRQDGWAYPSESSGLGSDYRILDAVDARAIADSTEALDAAQAGTVLHLCGAVRAISFLMEGETREALMAHGPYPLGGGRSLVFLECSDLTWSMFPAFPIPDQRWELPDIAFPYPNLAVALVVKDVEFTADRFGTLYPDVWNADNLVSAALMTRGPDEWCGGDLAVVPAQDAAELVRILEDMQDHFFLQIAGWTPRQRMAAGHFQKGMLALRVIASAGARGDELHRHFEFYKGVTEPLWGQWFELIFEQGDQLPFWGRLGEFIGGARPSFLTPPWRPDEEGTRA